jgi:hypothetical protein
VESGGSWRRDERVGPSGAGRIEQKTESRGEERRRGEKRGAGRIGESRAASESRAHLTRDR